MSTTETRPPVFHLHFEGEATRGHTVPAAALVQAVQALQRSVQLIAMAYEGQELKQRIRVSHELERKYALIFSVPQNGGYDIPYSVGSAAVSLFDPTDIAEVAGRHERFLTAVQQHDEAALKREIPSAQYRRLVLAELKKMQPPPRTGLVVSIEDYRGGKLLDGKTATAKLTPLLADPTVPVIHPQLVTGRLDALEFQARTLKLQLPNGRLLQGTYSDDFEPVLVEHRREFIQVRGEAVLNEDGSLKQLNNVQEILEVDESPLVVETVEGGGLKLAATVPVSFAVAFAPEDGIYVATGPFETMISAETRPELDTALTEAIVFLWREYVLADPATLSGDALLLRQELNDAFAEVIDAA